MKDVKTGGHDSNRVTLSKQQFIDDNVVGRQLGPQTDTKRSQQKKRNQSFSQWRKDKKKMTDSNSEIALSNLKTLDGKSP